MILLIFYVILNARSNCFLYPFFLNFSYPSILWMPAVRDSDHLEVASGSEK